MENQAVVGRVNKATFARDDVLKYFQNLETLFEAEKVLFERLAGSIRNSKILDIGIGGGRTTKYLLEISSDYTGIDYVAEFAEETSKKYPAARIMQGDARDLKEFEDETFDFVLFSYNGIDAVSHEDRLKALGEVHRVLKKGGAFIFSSHNRDYKYFNKLPWQQKVHFSRNYLMFSLHCLYHLPKHFKMKKHEIYAGDYAIVNDGDHRFSLLLYYISIDKQIRQLTDSGFSGVEAYNFKGERVERDTSSHWIYYLARKD
ncbi:MAG TPA: class I SAM-dependent methyltransferase [Pyrinomonadaceae bacterium]|nr:class I SAM-dependent methyltransferase [Pyrinomonadaceae bacterium]